MIIVIGTALTKPDTAGEALALSLEHVARSRAEDGCIDHTVSLDQENDRLLRFVEYWRDEAALLAHFAVPASRAFIGAITPLLAAAPDMKIFNADETSLG